MSNLFSFIKSHLSIIDVVNEYTSLKKAGTYWKGVCPFHVEKTPSFTVSPHKEIYYCFGCHSGGDVISFIAKAEQCSQLEAAKHLIERYQLSVPAEYMHMTAGSGEDKSRYEVVCDLVAQWVQKNFENSPLAQRYLSKRGLTRETVASFGLGYFYGGVGGIKNLLDYARQKNILADDLLKAGVVLEGKRNLFSPFEERIIFPIKDHVGRYCGFGGRIFRTDDERPKYYNSREHEFFAKGKLLFGLDRAKKSMQQRGYAFLVEGYMDCIVMAQYGYPNTVATLGTACTVDQLKVLARYVERLYVLYDGDPAGQEAIIRLTQLCWQVSLELSVVRLPEKEDPASLLVSGKKMDDYLAKSMNIFEFFIASQAADFATRSLQDKLHLIRSITDMIAKLDDALKQDLLFQQAATVLGMPLEALKHEAQRVRWQGGVHPEPVATPPQAKPEAASEDPLVAKLDKKIFFAIMNNTQLFNQDNEDFLLGCSIAPIKELLIKLRDEKKHNPAVDFKVFMTLMTPEQQQYVSKVMLEGEHDVHAEDFEHLLMMRKRKEWKNMVATMKSNLAGAQTGHDRPENAEKVLQEFLEIKKRMLAKKCI